MKAFFGVMSRFESPASGLRQPLVLGRHRGAVLLLALGVVGFCGQVPAATVGVPADTQPAGIAATHRTGLGDAAPTSTLDRALTGGVATGNQLDLLLEMQRHQAAEATLPAYGRAGAAGSSGPPSRAGSTGAGMPLAPLSSPAAATGRQSAALSQSHLLDRDAGLGTSARAVPTQDKPDWTGVNAAALGTDRYGANGRNGADLFDDRIGPNLAIDKGSARLWLRESIEFLRENRGWLLGSIAALLLLGAVLKGYARRA